MVKRISFVFAIVLLLFTCIACSTNKLENPVDKAAETRRIIDQAGRTVIVPAKIKKVYSVSPVGTIFMYTLAPDKLAGRNWEAAEGEKKYTLASYQSLPVLGGSFGKDKIMNQEEVLKVNPDLILQMGDINQASISTADILQQQLNIPVVVVGLDVEKMDQTYDFMGDLLDVKERAKKLAEYCKQTISDVKAKAAAIPTAKQVRVYYAEGNEGLETDPKGSAHTEVLDLVRGTNIADVAMQKGYGRTQVSIEQIMTWDPEVILVCYDQSFQTLQNPYDFIQSDEKWKQLKAVQSKKIYKIPHAPFNWFDRPPSVNRIIGVKWLANLLYPDYFTYDIKQEMKEFYKLFYHVELTEQDVEDILQHAK